MPIFGALVVQFLAWQRPSNAHVSFRRMYFRYRMRPRRRCQGVLMSEFDPPMSVAIRPRSSVPRPHVWTGCRVQLRFYRVSEVAHMYPACLIGSRAVALMGVRAHLLSN